MSFFRAVIYLLIRSKIYKYIAYQRTAGNQLTKLMQVQRSFSPCKKKYNLHTTEFVFLITVKVTEPLRFFFCRFLLESAVGLFLICGVVLRLSIWIFYISKIQMGGIYGEICTKKGIYQRKWRLCGIILHGVLPLQGIRPDLYGQAVYPHSRLSA